MDIQGFHSRRVWSLAVIGAKLVSLWFIVTWWSHEESESNLNTSLPDRNTVWSCWHCGETEGVFAVRYPNGFSNIGENGQRNYPRLRLEAWGIGRMSDVKIEFFVQNEWILFSEIFISVHNLDFLLIGSCSSFLMYLSTVLRWEVCLRVFCSFLL